MLPPNDRDNDSAFLKEGSGYDTSYHKPVLCKTVVDALITRTDGIYLDGTLGGGGHTAAILDALDPKGRVVAIDRDGEAISEVEARLAPAISAARLTLVRSEFGALESVLDQLRIPEIDGVLLDLGVSSHQIDEAQRGFSFRSEGPLDMRMDDGGARSAADFINTAEPSQIRQVLFSFGEVSAARRITDAICRARPFRDTASFAAAIQSVIPSRESAKILAQVFQAIRIAINDELGELERALKAATHRIRIGGRLAIISYHSLEDRRVKRFLRYGNLEGEARRDLHGNLLTPWSPLWRKAIAPDEEEIARNPRARSARLRAAERVETVDTPTI
jgi:16S rRNA (cytosine1402-N4)-methyltransferase